ncbi:MAG: type II CAAX endopeptidase family protein [Candidatus Marinimicrobia bacterium]|jgi:membrane protease YdiL (CAAX protease family)|nr:type II CAAX endopeptidase family protein [Candidatus Neomarinimicrobiota bacterium]MDD4961115.1 type II CAAX endopeptidase family protein [Candidatus Neomarinimicrobiota bacterium]MDD5709979.1 type II CAAX endopeptidase family protein [Candidatus Neomarinimicrobiota bacterium]MDX9777262.1 type II CAAX endopeptidase family protein [bacterium]
MSQYYNYKTAVLILLMSLVAYLVLVVGLYYNPDVMGKTPQAVRYIALIFFELLLLTPLLLYVIGNKKSIKHAFRLRPVPWRGMRDILFVAAGMFIVLELIRYLMQRFLDFEPLFRTDIRVEFPLNVILLFILSVIITPVVEEALFRGYLLRVMLRNKYSPLIAIITTSLLFSLSHLSYRNAPAIFVAGLILGYVAYSYYSIVPAILIHSMFNFIVLLDVNIPAARELILNASSWVAWLVAAGGILALTLGLMNIKNKVHIHRTKRQENTEGGGDEK